MHNLKHLTIMILWFEYLWELGQYHGCWCPGYLCGQVIGSHGIGYVEYTGSWLLCFLTNCIISVLRNNTKTKYVFKFPQNISAFNLLIHWGQVTHICISKLSIIGSDNSLLPNEQQAIIWTKGGILLIGPLETNFSEILLAIFIHSFKKMHLKLSSGIWWLFCLSLLIC